MDYFDEVVNNQTGCVYLIVKRQNKSFPKYQLATDSCNGATYGFICMKPTRKSGVLLRTKAISFKLSLL